MFPAPYRRGTPPYHSCYHTLPASWMAKGESAHCTLNRCAYRCARSSPPHSAFNSPECAAADAGGGAHRAAHRCSAPGDRRDWSDRAAT